MLEQFVPEVLHPTEWTSAGAALQELQFVGGTHAGAEEKHEEEGAERKGEEEAGKREGIFSFAFVYQLPSQAKQT